jgi:hypothetical protein
MSEAQSSLKPVKIKPGIRKVKTVPYVEMKGGRLQGVVSSGSDENRVYLNFYEAGSFNFNCMTNNNRDCSGLYGRGCKHLDELVEEAVEQYGASAVAHYLKIPADPETILSASQIKPYLQGSRSRTSASEIFSHFLQDLRFIELPPSQGTAPELSWFPI